MGAAAMQKLEQPTLVDFNTTLPIGVKATEFVLNQPQLQYHTSNTCKVNWVFLQPTLVDFNTTLLIEIIDRFLTD